MKTKQKHLSIFYRIIEAEDFCLLLKNLKKSYNTATLVEYSGIRETAALPVTSETVMLLLRIGQKKREMGLALRNSFMPVSYTHLEGTFITRGKAIPIKWVYEEEHGMTHYYDENGQEIRLNPGKTWVEIILNGTEDAVSIQ